MKEKDIIKKYKHGDKYTALLTRDRIPCVGKITIENDHVYFCQDEYSGQLCSDTQGYKYSYVYSQFVKDLVITPADLVVNDYQIF